MMLVWQAHCIRADEIPAEEVMAVVKSPSFNSRQLAISWYATRTSSEGQFMLMIQL